MTYVHIEHITAQEILDSRGKPTIEVEISGGGYTAKAAVPSGKSTGVNEAVEFLSAVSGDHLNLLCRGQRLAGGCGAFLAPA